MSTQESIYEPIRLKAGLLRLVFSAAFAVIIFRLFFVQVVEGARYQDLAKKQYESKVPLRAERGRLTDRNAREIASMMKMTSFAADPSVIEQRELVAQLLAAAGGESAQTYLDRIKTAKGRFVWLARAVNTVLFPVLDTINVKGLIRVKEPKRLFPHGPLAAQVIGTTDVDNAGLTGIELQYNELLRGRSGFVVMQRDGRGRLRPGINPEREAPMDGQGLQLTLDLEIQRVVEQELERGVRESGAASGTVVAIEPSSGDVLALASYPSFHPNRLDLASNDDIRIRAITDQFEPGSTMKAITAAALLEERQLAPGDAVDGGSGELLMPGGSIVKDDHPVGRTTFQGALEQSSNVVFATLSRKLDDRVFYKYVRDFGFGIPTGIDLPGEVRGRLKRPNEFDASTKMYMSFGYEVSATPLQVLCAYAAIANAGVLMQPRIVRSITARDGSLVREIPPQRIRQVVRAETAKQLTEMLVGVVDNGTGKRAAIPGVRIAGKTGTAQAYTQGAYDRKNYRASFVGFYPADKPRVAMMVILENPTNDIYGGSTAAPVFHRIVQKTMTMLKLDVRTQQTISAAPSTDTVVVPDVRGLTKSSADSVLQRLGLKSDVAGADGLVVHQWPDPGTKILRGSSVRVTVRTVSASGNKPYVIGFSMRKAITVLHAAGYEVRVTGSGKVSRQDWDGATCILTGSGSQ
ncbi:MAG: penicillin-binding transpeptidase domain-containing protein [Bacteroidota bacterium]|jgi:cell division protein FtsI (penicillin-binding protein 3)